MSAAYDYINLINVMIRLQDEYGRLEEEIRHTIEESKIVQDKYKTMYEQSRRELGDKAQQMEEFRSKVNI